MIFLVTFVIPNCLVQHDLNFKNYKYVTISLTFKIEFGSNTNKMLSFDLSPTYSRTILKKSARQKDSEDKNEGSSVDCASSNFFHGKIPMQIKEKGGQAQP